MAQPSVSNEAVNKYPNNDVTGSATATGSTATASLPAVANRTNYITGFDVTANGTVTAGTVTVTGAGSGTLTYAYPVGNFPLVIQFATPMVATSPNTAISVACSTLSAATSFVNVYGFLV